MIYLLLEKGLLGFIYQGIVVIMRTVDKIGHRAVKIGHRTRKIDGSTQKIGQKAIITKKIDLV